MFGISAKVIAGAEGHRNYDVDALTHIGRLSSPSTQLQGAINTLVVGLKIDGIWDKISVLCVFPKTTSAESLYDLKGVQDSTTVDSPFYLTGFGWLVGSGTGLINTQYSPVDSSLMNADDSHMMTYFNTTFTSGNLMGAGTSTSSQYSFVCNTGSVTSGTIAYLGEDWISGLKAELAVSSPSGFFLGSLLSGATATRVNSTEATNSGGAISAGDTANDMYVGNFNGAFSGIITPAARVTAWAMGGGLTAQERIDYYTHIEAYMVTMGLEA